MDFSQGHRVTGSFMDSHRLCDHPQSCWPALHVLSSSCQNNNSKNIWLAQRITCTRGGHPHTPLVTALTTAKMRVRVKNRLRQGSVAQEAFSNWVIKGSNSRFNDSNDMGPCTFGPFIRRRHPKTNCHSRKSISRSQVPLSVLAPKSKSRSWSFGTSVSNSKSRMVFPLFVLELSLPKRKAEVPKRIVRNRLP